MRIANPLTHLSYAHAGEARLLTKLITVSALALLQACAVSAPSCDGRFEPINLPAPVGIDADAGADAGEEGRSSEREDHE